MTKKDKKKQEKAENQIDEAVVDQEKTEELSEVEKLQQEIEELKAQRDDFKGKWQRVCADYDNFQKRVPKQINDRVAYEVESFVKTLLPGIDNFEHALKSEQSHDADSILKGIQIVHDHLMDIMKSNGVETIKALGEPFDPSMHQAMMQRADEEKEDGIILEEYQKGYTLKGKVVRPSMVVVNKLQNVAVEEEPEQDDQEEQEADNQ